MRALIVPALAAVTLLVGACSDRENAAPPTDVERRAEIIGVVTDVGSGEPYTLHRFTLDTGDVVDLNVFDNQGAPRTPRLSETNVNLPLEGDVPGKSYLLLVGQDPDGTTWYAAAREVGNDCPFAMEGAGVYDEGDALHFSSGLLLPKSPDFHTNMDYREDDFEIFPLRRADSLCVDRSGTALSAAIWLPY